MSAPTTTPVSPFTFGGIAAEEIKGTGPVVLTAADIADFNRAATYFSGQPNTVKLSFNLPADGDVSADDYRAKIKRYAELHDLSAGFPKFIDEHEVKARKATATKPARAAYTAPANKNPKHWNVGPNVTFRFSEKSDEDDVDTTTVTTTTVAQAATDSKAGAESAAKAAVDKIAKRPDHIVADAAKAAGKPLPSTPLLAK